MGDGKTFKRSRVVGQPQVTMGQGSQKGILAFSESQPSFTQAGCPWVVCKLLWAFWA